jgi:biopolymer transport protein ExbD
MFESVQHRRRTAHAQTHIDLTSLIDVIFILLLFFLVTTTFVRDAGVTVNRPQAVRSEPLASSAMRIVIVPSGAVFTDGRQVELGELGSLVKQFVAREPEGNVVVVTDESVSAGRLVEVMDAAKINGAKNVALATRQKGAR